MRFFLLLCLQKTLAIKNLLLYCSLLFPLLLPAQQAVVDWVKVMNGTQDDGFVRIDTFSGGYYLLGGSGSTDYDLTGVSSTYGHYWIVKMDTNRNVIWQRRYGSNTGGGDQKGVITTPDGGCLVVGRTYACNLDITCNSNCSQVIWLIKLDKDGNLLWQRCLGGSQWERVFDIDATSDGGALITGRTGSGDGDFNIHYGSVFVDDGFVLKVDSNGYVQWSRIIGGSSYDYPSAGHEISGNKYVVLLNTSSTDHDMAGLGASNYSCLVMVLDTSGSILQKKCFYGNGGLSLEDFVQLPSGDILFAGSTNSDTGLYAANHGGSDILLIKTDAQLNLLWLQLIGSSVNESMDYIQVDEAGNVYLAGNIYTNTGIFVHPHITSLPAKPEIACVKTDSAGNFIWSKTLGGEQEDYTSDLLYAQGRIQLVGVVRGPVDFFDTLPYNDYNGTAYWVALKEVPNDIAEQKQQKETVHIYPNPNKGELTIAFEDMPEGEMECLLISAAGAELHRQALANKRRQRIRLPANLPSGSYVLKVLQNQRCIHSQTILLQH